MKKRMQKRLRGLFAFRSLIREVKLIGARGQDCRQWSQPIEHNQRFPMMLLLIIWNDEQKSRGIPRRRQAGRRHI